MSIDLSAERMDELKELKDSGSEDFNVKAIELVGELIEAYTTESTVLAEMEDAGIDIPDEEDGDHPDQTDIAMNVIMKARDWGISRRVAEACQNESREVQKATMNELLDMENKLLGALELIFPEDTAVSDHKKIITSN
jgi:hypothetical protein